MRKLLKRLNLVLAAGIASLALCVIPYSGVQSEENTETVEVGDNGEGAGSHELQPLHDDIFEG